MRFLLPRPRDIFRGMALAAAALRARTKSGAAGPAAPAVFPPFPAERFPYRSRLPAPAYRRPPSIVAPRTPAGDRWHVAGLATSAPMTGDGPGCASQPQCRS